MDASKISEFWFTVLVVLAGGGLLTGVAALWNSVKSARKSDVEILRGIIDELRKRVAELETDNSKLRTRVTELETDNAKLRRKLGVNNDDKFSSRGLYLDS